MSRTVHIIYIATLVTVALLAVVAIVYFGKSYYQTDLTERFYHEDHAILKPSGSVGHGLGILGTLMMLFGVGSYMARKRVRGFSRLGILKHWLEFHIFLCTLGPFLVLFHTAFKFGGIVSISFWSMVGVVLSGVIGRFIYIQIPRTIEGRELSLDEVKDMKLSLNDTSSIVFTLDPTIMQQLLAATADRPQITGSNILSRSIQRRRGDLRVLRAASSTLRRQSISRREYKHLIKLVKRDLSLNHKIARLATMKKLFGYWHVAHLPFAIIMLLIMIIHVAVTLTFGYRWIF